MATTASTSTDRDLAFGSKSSGEIQINQAVDEASLRTVPIMDCYADVSNGITTGWNDEEAIFLPPGSEQQENDRLQQDPLYITPEVFGSMYLNNKQVDQDGNNSTEEPTTDPLQLLSVVDKVPHTTSTSDLTTSTQNTAEIEEPFVETSIWVESEELFPWITPTRVASYNATLRKFRCQDCGCVKPLNQITEHWLGFHSNMRVFQCPSCDFNTSWANCIRTHLKLKHGQHDNGRFHWKENPVLENVTKYLRQLKKNALSPIWVVIEESVTNKTGKRYTCPHCPYSSYRKDRIPRHAVIHSEEKSFKCCICDKQFTRLDHYKSHHRRIHKGKAFDFLKMENTAAKRDSKEASENMDNQQSTTTPPPQVPFNAKSSVQQQHSLQPVTETAASTSSGGAKRMKEKLYACIHCPWRGVDNYLLKRHLATHTKPFICAFCDYSTGRKYRIAAHVRKCH